MTKNGKLLVEVFKRLGLPCDLAVSITAIVLTTEMQRAEMAVWMWDNQVTDQNEIVDRAMSYSHLKKVRECVRTTNNDPLKEGGAILPKGK